MSNTSEPVGLAKGKLNQIEVLVVQSNPADTALTIEAFRAAGLTSSLRCVLDGDDALRYVHREDPYAEAALPDLIFLDLSLPVLSGLEVLKAIKTTPELMHIPIVVAAGSDDPEFVRAVYKLNGNCYMRKPGEIAQFAKFIESCYEFWGSIVTLAPKADRAATEKSQKARNYPMSGRARVQATQ